MLWGEYMFKIILIIIALFLSSVGIGEILHRIWMLFLRPESRKCFLLLPLSEGCVAEQVTAELEEMRWYGKNYADLLIALDCGISESERKICKHIEKTNGDFVLCKLEDIEEVIRKRG